VRDAVRVFLIAVCFLLLGAPAAYGSTAFAFITTTIQITATIVVLVLIWERFDARAEPSSTGSWRFEASITVACGLLIFLAARAWLHEITIYPNDTSRPDMLPIVDRGVREIVRFRNPYTTYYIPWKTTLSYGPMLWGPYVIPYLLHADLRFVSLTGLLFIPLACALAATAAALDARRLSAAAWLAMLAILVFNEPLRLFSSYAHTPVYWPLIALFAWLVARERWTAAAIACGLLVAARTTMISIAPILIMAAWHRNRPQFAKVALLIAASGAVLFVPFALWDPGALWYSMYGAYQVVIKTAVWDAGGARDTIGLTGPLLRKGWQAAVEPTQIVTMLVVYGAAWLALGRGRRPLPWIGLALFAFSATTLWPVEYIYFDVYVFFVCAALAETRWLEVRREVPMWIVALGAAAAVVVAAARLGIPLNTDIDVGSYADRSLLYVGFADNEEAGRTFAWVEGTNAEVLIPRRSNRDAVLDLTCEPNLPRRDSSQQMSVALNGSVLGTVELHEGWQTVTLPAPSSAWLIGVNSLRLSFTNAISPLEAGLGADARKLSVAFDRIAVRTQ
jgi:hypothetical protein